VVPALGDPALSPDGPGARPILLNRRAATRPTITGVERWAAELIPRLKALAPERYRVVEPPPTAGRAGGQTWEQVVLPLLALRAGASLIFSPANLAPVAWPRNVVIVHDAAVLRDPAAYSRAYVAWHRSVGALAARRAVRVLTVSEFSKRELTELLGLDPDRVEVIRGGVDERFSPAADPAPVAAALALERPYVLTVATADRRKNLAVLSEAARRLNQLGIELVWAGEARPYFAPGDGPGGARRVGYVPDRHLPGLFRGARAFVLPSRYEGLGLTCIEAMACGTPVVAADIPALQEACGDAALLVDSSDAKAVADAVVRAATEQPLQRSLAEAGVKRAASFSWDRAARAIDDQLAQLTSGVERSKGD
jgi:glycosyltransferase involved in cell wall biosynthesis